MIPRFYCPFPLAPGARVGLPEAAAHHALRVLRLGAGDPVILFDGRGGEWQAELADGKVGAGRTALVVLKSFAAREAESPLALTLVQGLPGGDKMDWVVEKCTELGVAAVQPLAAKRSVLKLSGERLARRIAHWNQIAAAACEQCGRNHVPRVAPVVDLPHYLGQTLAPKQEQNALRLLLSPTGGVPLRSLPAPAGPVIALVGPEGGWEAAELQAAQLAGFQAVSLGPRVLRTETAGIALLAAMQALWGDF